MSVKMKNRIKKWSKRVGITLFALLFLVNIKILLSDKNQIAKGDLSILGVELKLFNNTNAAYVTIDCDEGPTFLCRESYCNTGDQTCAYIVCPKYYIRCYIRWYPT